MDQVARSFPALGRIELAREADFTLGGLRIRPSRREVHAAGVRHVLQRRVMQVLVALAHPNAEVVSQDELIRRCWDGLAVSEDAIGRCIGQLRRLAAQWSEPPFAIETIAGVGYRLDAAAPAAGAPPFASEAPPHSTVPRRLWQALLALTVAVPLLAAWIGWVAEGPRSAPAPTRVAMLPLQALSDGPQARFLADSISDEVLGVLSANQVEALSGAETVALRGPSADRAARKMGVGLLLDGSVQSDAQDARVTVRLEDAANGVTLWSADFQRPAGSNEDLQNEVAAKVVDMIEMAEFARTARPPLGSDAALSALLEGHDLIRWERSGSWARLIEVAQRVVTLAPDFAFGHSMLSTANAYAIHWNAQPEQKAVFAAAARREAARALAIDPRDAGAYFTLSIIEPRLREREAILLRGLGANGHPSPPLAALENSEGELLLSVGRMRAGLPYIQRSQALDPLSPAKAETVVRVFTMLGRPDDAREALEQGLRRWPHHPDLRLAQFDFLMLAGGKDEALAFLGDPAQRPPGMAREAIGASREFLAAQGAGDRGLSVRAERSLMQAAADGVLRRQTAALMLARLGALDAAFELAGQFAAEPGSDPQFLFYQAAAPMRRDARFLPLVARFGVVDYWKSTGKWSDVCLGPHPEVDCRSAAKAAR